MSEKRTTTVSAEDLDEMEDRTDWEALREKTDEEIREAVEDDPDAYLLDEEWFENAVLVNPSAEKEQISIRLDEDILEFFRAGGSGYQSRINKVLREYVAAQKYKHQEEKGATEEV